MRPEGWLCAPWRDGRVGALMTTRAGGASRGAFAGFNLGDRVGDDAAAVRANRADFAAAIGATSVYLRQVHGARVVRLGRGDIDAALHAADASVTTEPGIACTVLVADCLPVLLRAPQARGVAAAHAGWRGLAAGVLEAALGALCECARCRPDEVAAWLGACIGPTRFEVGAEVREAFGAAGAPRFVATPAVGGVAKWHADLAGLARDRLAAAGVRDASGGAWCTVLDASRFFSFRRDRVTGRMAAAVWIDAAAAASRGRGEQVEHDAEGQHAVEQQGDERAEQAAMRAARLHDRHHHDDVHPADRDEDQQHRQDRVRSTGTAPLS